MVHIFRVQNGKYREWWICDNDGKRLLQSRQSKKTALLEWVSEYNGDPFELENRIRYRGVARPSEAAMAIADLRLHP